MGADARLQAIVQAVATQLRRDQSVAASCAQLGAQISTATASGQRLSECLRALAVTAQGHAQALTTYLASVSPDAGGWQAGVTAPGEPGAADLLSAAEIVGRVQAALAAAMNGYGILMALGFRLYEPALRELAPKHLRAYTSASQALNQMLPGVVSDELKVSGLDCHCVCPMCAIGACGCVVVSVRHINRSWREAVPQDDMDGLALQQPRAGSQFAQAGLLAEDRLLEVDGRPIRSLNDLMDGIRQHPRGEHVRLLVRRGEGEPQVIVAEHVSDYQTR